MIPSPTPEYINAVLTGAMFLALLTTAAVFDIRKHIIPNTISIGIVVLALPQAGLYSLVGLLTALPLLIAAMSSNGRMGGGDIKLCAACGFFLGLYPAITGTVLALAAAVLSYAVRRAAKRIPKGMAATAMPLGPYLAAGYAAAFFIWR